MTGTLYGVGLGPGDPELMTVKAARLISEASVIAYHCARHGRSIARSVAEPYLREGQIEEKLVYPVTTETTDHPGGYEGAIADFYELSAKRLAEHLDAGRDVVLLCEGDPFFYGSYMYMHERLSGRFPAVVVPGVTSVSAASSVLGRPLVQRDEVLTVLPGTLPAPELARRLADTDSAAVLKLGRTFGSVREAFAEAGKLEDALYVERATWGEQRVSPLADVDPSTVPYFSLALLPSPAYASRISPAPPSVPVTVTGEVVVVGLGPAGPEWLTPEASAELSEAEHIVGYGPYVARVPQKAGQQRHASGNRVEAERAVEALSLAASGARVAVVSSGDPGVFAMASAVLEQVAAGHGAGVRVRIVPGVTAAQAAASRVGAPLGHDYCVLSLSDRLKPWEIIEKRLNAAAEADLVLALYNPASRTRTTQLASARDVLLRHRTPETPVVVARDVGGPEEDIRVTTLGDLDPSTVDMRCLLIVGSSRTRVANGVVWTPRSY
ncbi:precorrin-2 C(20)-methyltransferase [Amycolatopsis sp. OK19-0408]|uniref:Precorrin-2 C(20)-methyltransferase n=1 Tax=Amycolatopsis iheyensis TaxID=2945988 RepID=A0A9X2NLM6_9PSEU|nr:precorrin-2 C(20)-methyltransferase [Amycolatopsis iheyensis]MCR6488809.1 precorrin-2 C(20)-methyltransferase [Amycolatopsis iheyensis]